MRDGTGDGRARRGGVKGKSKRRLDILENLSLYCEFDRKVLNCIIKIFL